FSIGVSAGTAIPVGLWGKKDAQDYKSNGFTQLGQSYNLSLSYKLNRGNFGLTSLIGRQINTVDTEAFANAYSENNEGETYTIESDDWRVNQFLVGGFYSNPVTKKLDIDVKALLGAVHANRPAIDVFDGNSNFTSSSGASSTALAYSLGVGIKYHLGKRLNFLVNADYLYSKPEFDVNEVFNAQPIGNSVFSQSISSINLSVGIAVKL
ncbi:MAG: hypothetical protein AAF573_10740, partial [Bacteroidota bacterium]